MTTTDRDAVDEGPRAGLGRLRYVGPGIAMAATGIGAGDMVNSLTAGSDYSTALLWAILLGVVIKFPLSEAVGRWYLSTGKTMLQAWYGLHPFTSYYFLIFLVLTTMATAAGVTSAAALAASAMMPGVLPVWGWAIVHSVAGFVLVLAGRYGLFEKVMGVFVALMFLTVIVLAVLVQPEPGQLAASAIPEIPDGSMIQLLALIGGVGGAHSLVFYPYWARERGWRSAKWISVMRTDLSLGYLMTGLFMIAMLIIGASFLYGTGMSIADEEGLVRLSGPLAERFGFVAKWTFLIGFWAAATTTIFGVWNGGSHLFADFVRVTRRASDDEAEHYLNGRNRFFRGFLVFTAFPPMLLLLLGEPVALVIAYSALGAVFFPFLAVTLLILLNSRRVPREHRNGWVSNVGLSVCTLFFLVWGAAAIAGYV